MMEQKKDGWCGPAALSYALKKQGINISQNKIAEKTHTTEEDGVDPHPLVSFVGKQDVQMRTFDGENAEKTLDEMRQFIYLGYSCVVDFLDGGDEDDGHYVVVEDIQDDKITIWDPSGGKTRTLKKDAFVKNWKDYTESGRLLKHWALCFVKV